MEPYMLLGFVGILREALLIFSKNGKLVAFITLLALFFNSIIYLSLTFSTKPLITDLVTKVTLLIFTSPSGSELADLLIGIKHDTLEIIGVEWIFILVQSITSLFFATATIYASAIIYGGKNISIKDMLSRIVRSWIRPFITWFYMNLFCGGYIFFVLAVLLPLRLVVETPFAFYATYIVIFIAATVFYTYLAVDFSMALVISVLEERCGIEALGKAGELVKGRKLHGFALNLLFYILIFIVLQGLKLITITSSTGLQILISLIVVNSIYLVQMIWFMAYTVYYYRCKKAHGEDIELQGTVEYSQIPTALLINENVP